MNFHPLKISKLEQPIENATTITFEVPKHLQETFHYHPGQHLIIKFLIEGKEVRRSYSLNSSPFKNEPLQVTVKRVKGGLVSNYINDQLEVGDALEVMTPQGRFFANIESDAYKTYFLFAAGSGITPIISILKSVLNQAPFSKVNLFYGNSNQESIIFKNELDTLEKTFVDRLSIIHTLSNPKVWSTWKQWKGRKGRIDDEAVEWFINELPPIAQSTEYYICGPGAMNKAVKKTLKELGIPKDLIHIEQFGGNVTESSSEINAVDNAQLSVSINGKSYDLNIPKGKTILQVLKTANTKPPYSCESGVCGTCACILKKGSVEMKANMALEDEDLKKGYILSCQALPTSTDIEIMFE